MYPGMSSKGAGNATNEGGERVENLSHDSLRAHSIAAARPDSNFATLGHLMNGEPLHAWPHRLPDACTFVVEERLREQQAHPKKSG
jgi:hypothetical protein